MRRTFADLEALGDLIADIAVIAESDEQRNESERSKYNDYQKKELLFSSVVVFKFHFLRSKQQTLRILELGIWWGRRRRRSSDGVLEVFEVWSVQCWECTDTHSLTLSLSVSVPFVLWRGEW